MWWNNLLVPSLSIAILAIGVSTQARSTEIGCPPTHKGKPLAHVSVFDGPPADHADLIPRDGGWDLLDPPASPNLPNYTLGCTYRGSKEHLSRLKGNGHRRTSASCHGLRVPELSTGQVPLIRQPQNERPQSPTMLSSRSRRFAKPLVLPRLIANATGHASSADIGCPPTHDGKPLKNVGLFDGPPSNKVELMPKPGRFVALSRWVAGTLARRTSSPSCCHVTSGFTSSRTIPTSSATDVIAQKAHHAPCQHGAHHFRRDPHGKRRDRMPTDAQR
jgi:hypothetical protein